jgi:hypothetical protein
MEQFCRNEFCARLSLSHKNEVSFFDFILRFKFSSKRNDFSLIFDKLLQLSQNNSHGNGFLLVRGYNLALSVISAR